MDTVINIWVSIENQLITKQYLRLYLIMLQSLFTTLLCLINIELFDNQLNRVFNRAACKFHT